MLYNREGQELMMMMMMMKKEEEKKKEEEEEINNNNNNNNFKNMLFIITMIVYCAVLPFYRTLPSLLTYCTANKQSYSLMLFGSGSGVHSFYIREHVPCSHS